MGAQFNSMTLRGSTDTVEKAFEKAQEQDRHENGHSYSGGFGMANGLSFEGNRRFKTNDEADSWLQDHAQKWEAAIAVKVDDPDGNFHWRIGAWCSS